ncbi:MAG TPA: hypothetical protein PLS68_07520 [Actinotalea sp.]|nr:hypothetical protein [Actinotalea sp.]
MRGRGAGLRATARIARRDALRARGRTALVAAMIGLPVLAASAGLTLSTSSVPTAERYVQWHLGATAQARIGEFVSPGLEQDLPGEGWGYAGTTPQLDQLLLVDYERDLDEALPAADTLVRVLSTYTWLRTSDGRSTRDVRLVEVPTGTAELGALVRVLDGHLPAVDGEIAVLPEHAERLGVDVGDHVVATGAGIAAATSSLTIVGLIAPNPSRIEALAAPGAVLDAAATLEPVQAVASWYVVGPAPVTWSHVLAINALGSPVTSRAVVLDPPEVTALTGTSYAPGFRTVAAAALAMALLEVILIVGPAFAVGARRSQRDLALLAAIGGDRRTLRRVVLLGGAVIGSIASVVAVVGGIGLAAGYRALDRLGGGFGLPDLRVPATVLLLVPFGALLATAAAWAPARHAARVDVVAALTGRRAEAQPRRRIPAVGLVVIALGAGGALVGAMTGSTALLVSGVVALEVGLVAASGALVALAGRLAPRTGPAGRLALRDAVRQRSRTAPAVAAVLAAMAGVVAGATYLTSGEQHLAAQYTPLAADGVAMLGFGAMDPSDPDRDALAESAVGVVRAGLAVTAMVPVSIVDPSGTVDGDSPTLSAERPPANVCPLQGDVTLPVAEVRAAWNDPRCGGVSGGSIAWTAPGTWDSTLVDDGTAIAALGLPRSERAAAALQSGAAVVASPLDLWPDGTVHLRVVAADLVTGDLLTGPTTVLPAVAVDLGNAGQYGLVVPPAAVAELGLTARLAGYVAQTSRAPTHAEQDAVEAALMAAVGPTVSLQLERGHSAAQPEVVWLLVAAATVVGLGATAIVTALAATEALPDLAILGAIGAAPALRRRFAAAQAGLVAGIGTLVGVLTGLLLGRVLVLAERYRGPVVDLDWQVVTPWSAVLAVAVGVPLLAAGGGFLLTRSRLPMVRRVVG